MAIELLIRSSVITSQRKDRGLKVPFSWLDLVMLSVSKGRALLRLFLVTITLLTVAPLKKRNRLEKIKGWIYH